MTRRGTVDQADERLGVSRRDALGWSAAAALLPGTLVGGCAQRRSASLAAERRLRASISGEIIARTDAGYEVARRGIWCANVPARYPQWIVRARSAEDVVAAVRHARANGLRVAIRGGGHNWSGASLRDEALMIDLAGLTRLTIDPAQRTAIVEPGVAGGALFQAAAAHGLTFPIAHCPSVPMSGFLLNGGYGFNAGDWGPSALHVAAIEVVTADGELVRASERENEDLFWAARGAGPGFFGIVTRFHLRLLAARRAVFATNYVFPLAATADATAALDEIRDETPDTVELTFLAAAAGGPPDSPAIGVVSGIAFRDDEAAARRDLEFLESYAMAEHALVAERRVPLGWLELFEAVAALFPPRMRYLGNTIWTNSRVAELYTPYAAHLGSAPTAQAFSNCVIYPRSFPRHLQAMNGALSMHGTMLSLQYAIWQDPAEDARNERWFRQSSALFAPHALGHYLGESDLNLYPEYARRSFSPEAWEQLAAVRRRRDPDRRFFGYVGNDEPLA